MRLTCPSVRLSGAQSVGLYALGSRVPRTEPQGAPPAPRLSVRAQHCLRPLCFALRPALCCLFPSPGRPHPRPRPAPNPPTSPRAGFGHLRPAAWPHSSMGSDPSVPCSACFLDQRPTVFLLHVSLPGLRRQRAGCWWNPTLLLPDCVVVDKSLLLTEPRLPRSKMGTVLASILHRVMVSIRDLRIQNTKHRWSLENHLILTQTLFSRQDTVWGRGPVWERVSPGSPRKSLVEFRLKMH